MPCYHPIAAWELLKVLTAKGKPTISFQDPFAVPSEDRVAIQLPCGKCLGCCLERARQWSVRCVHEAQLHDASSFITLTYDPKFLPEYGTLVKDHFKLFMYRLRQAIKPVRIKFFMCGEYGELGRPHYHALIFGFGFPDRVFLKEERGNRLYRSPLLESLWEFGFSTVGDVTSESASYVARYALKKVHVEPGMDADEFSGQIPEYINMSRRGGVGSDWYLKFESDVFPCDNVVVRGKMGKPPRFYDKKLEVDKPGVFAKIKSIRKAKALENAADNTRERLKVKEQCKIAQVSLLKRGLK